MVDRDEQLRRARRKANEEIVELIYIINEMVKEINTLPTRDDPAISIATLSRSLVNVHGCDQYIASMLAVAIHRIAGILGGDSSPE